jgi:carboxymethylenebutenolidase
MEAFGVTSHIEKVCDQYAANGYVAIAPALYHRQHPNPKLGYDEMPAVQGYMGALQDNEIIEDVNVAIDYLQNKYKRTAGQKIGIVGYCVGGRIAYLAATSCPGLSAASVYYGGRILVPFGDGPAPIDLTGNITIPVMGNFGDDDENPSPADVATIDSALTAAGVTHDFKSYPGAGHGFNCDDRGSYNEAAATDAFSRTLAFFNSNVK